MTAVTASLPLNSPHANNGEALVLLERATFITHSLRLEVRGRVPMNLISHVSVRRESSLNCGINQKETGRSTSIKYQAWVSGALGAVAKYLTKW